MTIGQQAKENFTNLLKNGVEDDLVENLQLADFSKKNFGVNFPILHKGNEGLNKSRYYSKPIFEDYYLTNDWYEKNADKLKEAFEIFGTVISKKDVKDEDLIDSFLTVLSNYEDSLDDKVSLKYENGLVINIEYSELEDEDEITDELDALGANEEDWNELLRSFHDDEIINLFVFTIDIPEFEDIELVFTKLYASGDGIEINGVFLEDDIVSSQELLNIFENMKNLEPIEVE